MKAHKTVSGLVNEGHTVTMVLKSYLNQKKLRANAQEAIQELTAFLRGKGYVPCCQYCGRETETEGYLVSGNHIGLCAQPLWRRTLRWHRIRKMKRKKI